MQDLRAVNEAIIPIHPLVPNPMPSSPKCQGTPNISLFWTSKMHFSVFPYNQTLNIFLSLNERTLIPEATQDTGTEMLRGFQDGPYLFEKALTKELREPRLPKGNSAWLLTAVASLSVEHQLWGARAAGVAARGLSGCSPQALDRRLSSRATRVQPLCSLWALPGPGIEPVSPVLLASRFLSTAPPGKSKIHPSFLTSINMSSASLEGQVQSKRLGLLGFPY